MFDRVCYIVNTCRVCDKGLNVLLGSIIQMWQRITSINSNNCQVNPVQTPTLCSNILNTT